ncbi:M20 family metallopeptidase [Promineifilum sp.]|uniref:M20 family metallopeptidase n=1 Tax=Promineifilum sp. TaxID=2664178 RepID=UPI0035B382F1
MDWNSLLADCVSFAQRLIRMPSMSGEEMALAALVAAELRDLGYDEVWADPAGNIYGRVYGRDRSLPALVLNTHLDHVDPGDPALWPAPPFAAEIRDGRLIGRGAVDIKGPLAVQVYSAAALLRAGERPQRDVVFCGVVQEEIGGAGALYWVEHLDYPVELVVLGEPSGNILALGHRGIVEFWLTFHGRSGHASAPERAVNPNYALAAFLTRLEAAQGQLRAHPVLGPTSVAPTIIQVDTTSGNVTPAWTRVLLDFRTAAESVNSLCAFIDRLAGDAPHALAYADGLTPSPLTSSDDVLCGFYTPPDSPLVARAATAIGRGMGRAAELGHYHFATDGRHFAPYGLTVVGYAPGEWYAAHTAGESIALDEMGESLRGHVQLLREF